MTQENLTLTQLVIFGASGDLSQRKLFPALFNLAIKNRLPQNLQIIGASRRTWTDEDFRGQVREFLQKFATEEIKANQDKWEEFAQCLQFVTVEFNNISHFNDLKNRLSQSASNHSPAKQILYYAVAPEFFQPITNSLAASDFKCDGCRVVVEKPFGSDFQSARSLAEELNNVFTDEQIYRIDHVLSKNALVDVYSFRQTNYVFNQLFSNKFVDHIQITYSENIGVEDRGEFYEQTGAMRDMVQGHILEALSLVMSDLPKENTVESAHAMRAQLIESLEYTGKDDLVIGQYEGYQSEQDVSQESQVETFVALKITSNLPRWQGVPIYIRTGKNMSEKYLDIHIVFKEDPKIQKDKQNVLSFRISPNSGVNFRIFGEDLLARDTQDPVMRTVDLTHCYKMLPMDAYENLLLEIINGNNLFFVSEREIFASWKLVDQVRADFAAVPLHSYRPGSEGPAAATDLISRSGASWLNNTISDFCRI